MSESETRQFTLRGMFILMTATAGWLGMSLAMGPVGFIVGGVLCATATIYFCWPRRAELAIAFAIITLLIIGLMPDVQFASGDHSRGSLCRNNLRQIGLALRSYHSVHNSFMPLVTYSNSGRPLHSWRTHILPYIERTHIAGEYDWTEPWNGPVNSSIDATKMRVFQCPSDPAAMRGGISYLAIEVPGAKPGDPFVVIEVHGSGIGFFEPRDISLDDLLATKPSARGITPRAAHHKTVQILWSDGQVEPIHIADLPQRLANLKTAAADSP